MISENAIVFFDRKVKDFQSTDDWKGNAYAYRIQTDWDSPAGTFQRLLDELAGHKHSPQLEALVIGPWHDENEVDRSSAGAIAALVEHKDHLSGLRAIFFGDITYEQNEISWIQQGDVTPLLDAFPRLELLRVRGGTGLSFAKIRHEALKQLIVETGGLPSSVIHEICCCEFPNLEHLELWLGTDNYGWDGSVADLEPILSGGHFPKLKYLGLRNSEITDEIAPVLVNAPILKQLEVLDLSNGTLSDPGGRALLNLPAGIPLKELNLSHHYMTEAVVAELQKTLPFKVVANDPKDPNEEWRSTLVSE